jgi:hypothetical protein
MLVLPLYITLLNGSIKSIQTTTPIELIAPPVINVDEELDSIKKDVLELIKKFDIDFKGGWQIIMKIKKVIKKIEIPILTTISNK